MSRNINMLLVGFIFILFISQSNCGEIFVTATNGTSSNETNTNNTNTTNISAYCQSIDDTNCTYTQAQLIQILTDHTATFTPTVVDNSGNVILCPTTCISCTSGSECTACLIGYALDSSNRCVPCKGCKTCQNTNQANCTSCYLPQVLNVATNVCESPVGCTNPGCQTCNSDLTTCLTCYKGYSLHNNDCKPCIYGCQKCTVSETSCDSDGCGAGYIYFQNTRTNINECLECTAGCVYCQVTNLYNCAGCLQGYYPQIDNTKTPPANTCVPCFSFCKTCTSSTACTACVQGYKLTSDNLRCVLVCDSSCHTCVQNQPTQCLSCFGGSTYSSSAQTCTPDITDCNQAGTCTGCPNQMVLTSSGTCVSCTFTDTNCKGCLETDLATCTLCHAGYYLSATSTCTQCNTECRTCLSQYACSSCQSGYYLKAQTGQVVGTCVACEDPCLTCFQKATVCMSCKTGYTLQGRKCQGQYNVYFSIEIDINFDNWPTISSAYAEFITGIVSQYYPNFDFRNLIISGLAPGSTIVQGTASVETEAQAIAVNQGIATTAVAGVLVGGSPIIGATTTVNGITASSSTSTNLGLILGVSIPLLLIIIAILVVIAVKLSKKQKYDEYDNVRKDFVSDTQKGIEESV